MSAGGLRERVAEVIREHAPDEGDCICSEYVLDVPHAAHLADAVLAEVRAWLGSDEVAEEIDRAYGDTPGRSFRAEQAGRNLAALIDQTKETPVRTNPAYAECHCVVADGRWRRQAEYCPQHVDGETWRDA